MKAPVPSLTTKGWISDVREACDSLLTHFYTSNFSQTQLYHKNVSSLQYILQETAQNEGALKQELERTLSKYLGRYFDHVGVQVQVLPTDGDDSVQTIRINVTITDNNKDYDLGSELKASHGTVKAVSELLNNGSM